MYLDSADVYGVLHGLGVKRLYHVNTVRTACSYLRTSGLWSRGAAEVRGLDQTPQASDDVDQRLGIWYDIFVDAVPLHYRAGRRCPYGPVTFVLTPDILLRDGAHPVRITRSNPIYWPQANVTADYFGSLDELKANFDTGSFRMSLTIRHSNSRLPIANYLDKIRLDHPRLKIGGISLYAQALGALITSARVGDVWDESLFEQHKCRDNCACRSQYNSLDVSALLRLFEP